MPQDNVYGVEFKRKCIELGTTITLFSVLLHFQPSTFSVENVVSAVLCAFYCINTQS